MRVLSKPAAAERLGNACVRTIERMMDRGELVRVQISPRRVGVLEDSINAHIERQCDRKAA
jgi:hypothetical protein